MNSRLVPYALALGALLGLTALAFAVGRYPVSIGEIVSLLIAKLTGSGHTLPANVETVVLQVRGPRVLAALVVGAALAAAGTAYQGMFRNPLVMFGLGPIWALVIEPRFISRKMRPRIRNSVLLTNVVLVAAVVLAAVGGGTKGSGKKWAADQQHADVAPLVVRA